MRPWRITTIHLDDDENAVAVTAVVAGDMFDRLRQHLNDTHPIDVVRSEHDGALLHVQVDVPQLLSIYRSARDRPRTDPAYVPGLWASIDRIAAFLMG
jgi:hypothetical protein